MSHSFRFTFGLSDLYRQGMHSAVHNVIQGCLSFFISQKRRLILIAVISLVFALKAPTSRSAALLGPSGLRMVRIFARLYSIDAHHDFFQTRSSSSCTV